MRPWLDRSLHVVRRMVRLVRPVLILGLIGLVFYLGIQSERTGFVRDVLDPGLKRIVLPVLNAFRGSPPVPPQLALLVDPASMDSLSAIRARALEAGVLDEGKDNWFPARMVWNGDTINARLRLKGGLTDHLRTDKWSFRVQLDSAALVMGMNTFSLQHPNTRNFTHEWVFHQLLREEDLPYLLYDFLDVTINGKHLGLHAIEQHFDATLLARLGLHGPIMKWDDEPRIGTLRQMNERFFDSDAPIQGDWQSAPVDAFHPDDLENDPNGVERFKRIMAAMEAFRTGQQHTSEVFDAAKTARFFALCDLLGAQHAQDWRNLRFVQDTLSGKLVPIGFDGNAGEPITSIRAARPEQGPLLFDQHALGNFFALLFSDTTFYTKYISYLDTMSTAGWLEDHLAPIDSALSVRTELVEGEFPGFRYDVRIAQHCRTVIRQTLDPQDLMIARRDEPGAITASNMQALPLSVNAAVIGADTIAIRPAVVLLPRGRGEALRYVRIPLPANVPEDERIKLLVQLIGLGPSHTVKVKNAPH